MIRLTVSYLNQPGSHFNLDYYLTKHMPMVEEKLRPHGLLNWEVEQGADGLAPGTPAKYQIQANLNFPTLEAMQAAVGAEGPALMADVPNYTDVQPEVHVYKVLR